MCYVANVNRLVAVILLVLFSLILTSCSDGGDGGGGKTDGGVSDVSGSGENIAAKDINNIFYGTADFDASSCRNTDSLSI